MSQFSLGQKSNSRFWNLSEVPSALFGVKISAPQVIFLSQLDCIKDMH